MKMTKEDYQKLRDAIGDVPLDMPFSFPIMQRWNLFHFVNRAPSFPFRHLYDYLNDDHIDTALRKIVCDMTMRKTEGLLT